MPTASRKSVQVLALSVLATICLSGCRPSAPLGYVPDDQACQDQPAASSAHLTPDPQFGVSPFYCAKYRTISVSNRGQKNQGVQRRNVYAKIGVPAGLSKQDLEANLRSAALKLCHRYHTPVVLIDAYTNSENWTGNYTAGQLLYAPYGDWAQQIVDSEPAGSYRVVIHLAPGYFTSRLGANP